MVWIINYAIKKVNIKTYNGDKFFFVFRETSTESMDEILRIRRKTLYNQSIEHHRKRKRYHIAQLIIFVFNVFVNLL